MPQLSAVPILLSETEKEELEKLLRRSRTPQQIAVRAKIILRATAGDPCESATRSKSRCTQTT